MKALVRYITYLSLSFFGAVYGQVANFVANGGFEDYYNCTNSNYINKLKSWRSLDSLSWPGVYAYNKCFGVVPNESNTRYQWPFKGNGFGMATFLCQPPCTPNPNRGYFRNRLKATLKSNRTYCVKLYYNVVNNSNYGINSFGAYFGDNSLDTITKGFVRITYLNPQVQNINSNFATDTLNWQLLTGTFTASGTEKYMVIGNFRSDTNTGKVLIYNNSPIPYIGCDLNIDHVSCIDVDLPAFAGHDTSCIPGTTIYLGRQRDVGIDEACMWYKLPITITPTTPAIDTAAGIWVSPTQTSTYVVRQEICGNVKWDTVVVYKDAVGLGELIMQSEALRIFPVPAQDYLQLSVENEENIKEFKSLYLYDHLGKFIREEELVFKNKQAGIQTADLPKGLYFLEIKATTGQSLHKRFLVNR